MNTKILVYIQKLKKLLEDYPLVVISSFVLMLTTLVSIENSNSNPLETLELMKMQIIAALAISFTFAIAILTQRIGKTYLCNALGVLVLIVYYFLLLKPIEKEFSEKTIIIVVISFVFSHLLVAFLAFLNRPFSEQNFWTFNKNLFMNWVLTTIFSLVLTGGVLLATEAIKQLFGVAVSENVYGRIHAIFTIFGSTVIFLLFAEEGLKSLEKESDYPIVLQFFTQFILIPLLILYGLILYFYTGKIVIQWDLPQGWVSYLIIAYSLVGIFALLLVHPLRKKTDKSWVQWFSKIFYYSLMPLMVLLFVAIFTRVLEYGFTEKRYFVVLIAIWLMLILLYFIFNPKNNIRFIPLSLAAFALIAITMPYFNAFTVSIRSQKTQWKKILEENNLLKNNAIDFKKPIADSIAVELDNKFEYLMEKNQDDYLKHYLAKEHQFILAKDKNTNFTTYKNPSKRLKELFENKIPSKKSKKNNEQALFIDNINQAIKTQDYDLIYLINSSTNSLELENGDKITVNQAKKELHLQLKNGTKLSHSFLPFTKSIFANPENVSNEEANLEEVFLLGNYKMKMVFFSMTQHEEPKKEDIELRYNILLLKTQ